MRTMSKLAKVTISEKSTVMEMMLRIIGSVTYQIFCHQLAPSISAASYSCSGTDLSAARYMIRKNGAPYQTLTRITENRAQYGSLSQGTDSRPSLMRTQLMAEWVGSNSHHRLSDDSASGMTHGTSSMPRHLRWPLLGRLLIRCAVISPSRALNNTAKQAKIAVCSATIQN